MPTRVVFRCDLCLALPDPLTQLALERQIRGSRLGCLQEQVRRTNPYGKATGRKVPAKSWARSMSIHRGTPKKKEEWQVDTVPFGEISPLHILSPRLCRSQLTRQLIRRALAIVRRDA